jgi:hypothetical protein
LIKSSRVARAGPRRSCSFSASLPGGAKPYTIWEETFDPKVGRALGMKRTLFGGITPGASFEERLMKQHPQIEDAIEELCRTLARVHELENHMKNSDDSILLFIWTKYYEAAVRQSKRIEPNDWIVVK